MSFARGFYYGDNGAQYAFELGLRDTFDSNDRFALMMTFVPSLTRNTGELAMYQTGKFSNNVSNEPRNCGLERDSSNHRATHLSP